MKQREVTKVKPVVVKVNKNGKIELTIEELQKMLEDAYEEGKRDRELPLFPPASVT